MILGIDASTPGSGGARRHLIELLKNVDPVSYGFSRVKLWGVQSVLDMIPNYPWLDKISHPYLNRGFFFRTFWQFFLRDRSFRNNNLNVLFCPFGTYIGSISPFVTMSRNMLIFDKNEKKRFPFFSTIRVKLRLLYFTQIRSFNKAAGVIFLSKYAQASIVKIAHIDKVNQCIINHGVSSEFDKAPIKTANDFSEKNNFKVLYISTIWAYKHPVNVVKAIANLRAKGYPVQLDIVGNPEEKNTSLKLQNEIESGGHSPYVTWHQKVHLNEIFAYYKNSDLFVFASTCENMPNILIEAMSSGLPIACSSYPPMPEFLEDAGVYFDPEKSDTIGLAIEKLLLDPELRYNLACGSYRKSQLYTWERCAKETFEFLSKTAKK